MRKRYRHKEIVKEISSELNMNPKVIHLILSNFYKTLRMLISKNEEINIKGFFILKLASNYKKRIKKEGKNINLRKRKDQKYTYEKKLKK